MLLLGHAMQQRVNIQISNFKGLLVTFCRELFSYFLKGNIKRLFAGNYLVIFCREIFSDFLQGIIYLSFLHGNYLVTFCRELFSYFLKENIKRLFAGNLIKKVN